jgi:DNA-binding LytR/AlgR family response regulator
VTTGEHSGTSGDLPMGPWTAVTLAILLVVTVNATSEMLDMVGHAGMAWWEPVLWEASSALVIAAMAPLIGRAVRRWRPRRDRVGRFVLTHLALTVPFALVHVGGIAVLRNAVYLMAGREYGFFDRGVALRLLYEWRKDALIYAAIALVYWWYQSQSARPLEPAAGDERIEIRDGGGAVFLPAGEILFVEAAGNYVEFHTASRAHLVRGTLATWQDRLASRGFVRAHRSRLINRARIHTLKPTPAGDVEITLDTGRALLGSRRYRAALAATPGG